MQTNVMFSSKTDDWSTPQLFAISHIMNCDLNHLFISYSYRDKSDFFVKFL